MRVYELFEDEQDPARDRFDPAAVAALLQQKCSTFVDAYRSTHHLLIRGIADTKGMSGEESAFVHFPIRQDRKPVFMNPQDHNIINTAMQELGLLAHRGNSIFCTSSVKIAKDWGKVYAVFPENGWTGTVFENVKRGYVYTELRDAAFALRADKDKAAKLKSVIEALKPRSFDTSSELHEIIQDGYEDILITGSGYYGLAMVVKGGILTPRTKKIAQVFDELGIKL